MDEDNLLKQAYEKLDNNDFAGARDDYRRAAMGSLTDPTLLPNLKTAEKCERWVFLKKVREAHPDSFKAWIHEGGALEEAGLLDWALTHYTEMLIQFEVNTSQHIDLRMHRLSVACKRGKTDFIVDDLCKLWAMGDHDTQAKKARPLIIILLNRDLNNTRDLSTLESLCQDPRIPIIVQNLFKIKIAQLTEVAEIQTQLKQGTTNKTTETSAIDKSQDGD